MTAKKNKNNNNENGSNTGEMTFFQHLGELRKRVFYALGFILVFFMVSWAFVEKIYIWLAQPVLQLQSWSEALSKLVQRRL